MEEIKKTQNQKQKEKITHKNKQKSKLKAEKDKYFGYYDDIKIGSHKVVDW